MISATVTTTLPVWLPYLNVILSIVALALGVSLTGLLVRRGRGQVYLRLLKLAVVCGGLAIVAASVVLVGGALNQSGVLPLEAWVVLGVGGRMTLIIFELVLIVTLLEGQPDD